MAYLGQHASVLQRQQEVGLTFEQMFELYADRNASRKGEDQKVEESPELPPPPSSPSTEESQKLIDESWEKLKRDRSVFRDHAVGTVTLEKMEETLGAAERDEIRECDMEALFAISERKRQENMFKLPRIGYEEPDRTFRPVRRLRREKDNTPAVVPDEEQAVVSAKKRGRPPRPDSARNRAKRPRGRPRKAVVPTEHAEDASEPSAADDKYKEPLSPVEIMPARVILGADEKWNQFVARARVSTTFHVGARSDAGEHPHARDYMPDELYQSRPVANLRTLYYAMRERHGSSLIPTDEIDKALETRLRGRHFASAEWKEAMRDHATLPGPRFSSLRDASLSNTVLDEGFADRIYHKTEGLQPIELFSLRRTRIFGGHDSDQLIYGSRLFREYDGDDAWQHLNGTMYPPRHVPSQPDECIDEGIRRLGSHNMYLRVVNTLPGFTTAPAPPAPPPTYYTHGSLEDVADWYRQAHILERLADPVSGPTLRLDTEFNRILSAEWGGGIWPGYEDLGWERDARAGPFISSLLVRLSCLSLPSIIAPEQEGIPLHLLPWKDQRPPEGLSRDELAVFAHVHLEFLAVQTAARVAEELERNFHYDFAYPALQLDDPAVAMIRRQVGRLIESYVHARYFLLRRVRSLVASFGEYLFSPGLWNVTYRPLRVLPIYIDPQHHDVEKKVEKHHKIDAVYAFESSWPTGNKKAFRIFAKNPRGGGYSLAQEYVRCTRRYLLHSDPYQGWPEGERWELGTPETLLRVLYALVYMRSLDSFAMSRKPPDDPSIAASAESQERVATELPECLVYDPRFGAPPPELPVSREGGWYRTHDRGGIHGEEKEFFTGYAELLSRRLQDQQKLWVGVAFKPLLYTELYHAYATDLFAQEYSRVKSASKHGPRRLYLPWLFHQVLLERVRLDARVREEELELDAASVPVDSSIAVQELVELFDAEIMPWDGTEADSFVRAECIKVLCKFRQSENASRAGFVDFSCSEHRVNLARNAMRYLSFTRVGKFFPRYRGNLAGWLQRQKPGLSLGKAMRKVLE